MPRRSNAAPKIDFSNTAAIEQAVREHVDNILVLENQRARINDEIGTHRKRLKGLGVPPVALNRAKAEYLLDRAKRKAIDDGYELCRRALGIEFGADVIVAEGHEPDAEYEPDAESEHVH